MFVLSIFMLSLPVNCVQAQNLDTSLMPKKQLQLDNGIVWHDAWEGYSVLRYGIHDRFEVRAQFDIGKYDTELEQVLGIQPLTVSAVYRLLNSNGIAPSINTTMNLGIPFAATSDFKGERFLASWFLDFEQLLPQNWQISYSAGLSTPDFGNKPIYHGGLNVGHAPTERIMYFAEYFLEGTPGQPIVSTVDAWFYYTFSDRYSAGVSIGRSGLDNSGSNFAVVEFTIVF